MPLFKVRDLMISVLPEGGRAQGLFCGGVSFCAYPTRCNVTFPNCGATCVDLSYVGCGVTVCPNNITRCWQVTLLEACDAGVSECDACVTKGGTKTGQCAPGTGPPLEHTDLQLENLAVLKQQLKESLAKVEAQERVLEESLRPQTLEEIQQLESKLNAAFEELKMRKAELERGTPKGEA